MQDFVVGFIDPNEPDEIKPPAPKSDDDEEVIDTGPDPDEVKARVRVIRRHHNRAMKYLEQHGLKDKAVDKDGLRDTWNWVDKDYTLVTVPDAGHFVQWEAAELVSDTMKWWLNARD